MANPTLAIPLSPYQSAIIAWPHDKTAKRNLLVDAKAGSGKTFTLKRLAETFPPTVQGTMVCFNTSIAEKLKQDLPANFTASTLHSIGNRAWRLFTSARKSSVETVKDKLRRLHTEMLEDGTMSKEIPTGLVIKLCSLAKTVGLVPAGTRAMDGLVSDAPESWATMINHFGIDFRDPAQIPLAIDCARKLLTASIRKSMTMIDFDDMLYMSALSCAPFPKYDVIMVDEAQDLSPLQRVMVLKMASQGGRVIAVGDRNQAIYGFRGADVHSMDEFKRALDADELPLSICYRCPVSVIKVAQGIVPAIEAAPGAKAGKVEHLDTFEAEIFKRGDIVICRNRAPIVELAYKLLAKRVPVRVLGSDIGEGLATLIKSFRKDDPYAMIEALRRHTMRQISLAEAKDDEDAVQRFMDQEKTIEAIVEGNNDCTTVAELCVRIRDMFGEIAHDRLMLSTIHKAKGLEYPRVFFLDCHLLPSKGARKDWQKVQEKNLEYVAVTRAADTLTYISSEGLS